MQIPLSSSSTVQPLARTRGRFPVFFVPLMCLSLMFNACEKNTLTPVSTGAGAPFVLDATVAATSPLNIDNIAPVNGRYVISATVSAHVSDPDGPGDIALASYRVYKLSSGDILASGTLTRLSGLPDSTYATFSGDVSFSVGPSETGTYRIEITAEDNAHLVSNAFTRSLRVTRSNSAPFLGIPGIVTLASPSPDSARFLLSVAATDSDGLEDISAVTVRVLNTTDASPRQMFDDGLARSGDTFPGDGIFSSIVTVKPSGALAIVFEFSASDRAGALSATVRRSLSNHAPHIDSLVVPDSIQLPSTGTALVFFYMVASDSDGLGDIDSAYFRNESSSTPTSTLMYDDGDFTAHGDDTAGDGVFSRILSIDAGTSTGNKEFHFFVIDKEKASSTKVKIIKIYR